MSPLRLVIYGVPGTSVFEVADRLSSFHELDYFVIEKVAENNSSYWDDTIAQVDFDTGDFTNGSESSHMVRSPGVIRMDKRLEQADASIPDSFGYEDCLSSEELQHVFSLQQGIVATEIPDRKLVEWASHVVFLYADEKNVIDWFSKRRVCRTCRAVYHLEEKVPVTINRCDRDGSDLVREDKDDPAEIKRQFKDWRNSFWKFEETAKQKGIYKKVNVDKMKDFDDLVSRVNLWTRNEIEKMETWWDTALELS